MLNILIDPSNERKIADFRRLGLRDVMALGRYAYARARRPLARHSHGDMIEICYLDEGVQPYVVGGKKFTLKGGDVLVTFPREVHGTGGVPENRGRLYWMLLRVPGRRERFLNLPPPEAGELVRALRTLSPRHFRGAPMMKHCLERMFEAHGRADGLRRAEIRNWALRFLLDVVAAARRHAGGRVSPAIRDAQAFIEERLGEEALGLESLAASAGLSLPWFKARFKREVGVSPRHYVLVRKVEKAKERLVRSGASITSVAMDLGFSTSQYFATVFRRYTGMTPGRFRSRAGRRGAQRLLDRPRPGPL